MTYSEFAQESTGTGLDNPYAMWYSFLAFVALVLPFDSFRGPQGQTCRPFFCGPEVAETPGTPAGDARLRPGRQPQKVFQFQRVALDRSSNSKEDVVHVLQEGQNLKHEVYGLGVVTSSDFERTAIEFEDYGYKLFVTSIMTAELIGEAPANPVKPKRRRKKPSASAKPSKKAAAATR
jgi:hypothetical protein